MKHAGYLTENRAAGNPAVLSQRGLMTRYLLPAAVLLSTLLTLPVSAATGSTTQFDREQMMILNLNRGPGSSGWLVVEALKQSRAAIKELDKSKRQLQQADLNFAKYKGKPDTRYLEPAAAKIQQAEETARLLEAQLKDAYEELKGGIQQTLIMP